MLYAIEHTLKLFVIDKYPVGAVAKDVWMIGIHKKTGKQPVTLILQFLSTIKASISN
jgi:hypothetical protein